MTSTRRLVPAAAMPAAPMSMAHTLAYWLNSIYQEKPPTWGIRRRTTLAIMTRNMTASRTAPMAVVTVSIVFWIFVSTVKHSSHSEWDGAGAPGPPGGKHGPPVPAAGTGGPFHVIL